MLPQIRRPIRFTVQDSCITIDSKVTDKIICEIIDVQQKNNTTKILALGNTRIKRLSWKYFPSTTMQRHEAQNLTGNCKRHEFEKKTCKPNSIKSCWYINNFNLRSTGYNKSNFYPLPLSKGQQLSKYNKSNNKNKKMITIFKVIN